MYSLGGVLYHCLAGEPPYRRDTEFLVLDAHLRDPAPVLSAARPDLPRALDGVLATALAKAPGARYATAGALAEAFRVALDGGTSADEDVTRAAPATRVPGPTAEPRRPRSVGVRALLVGAVLVAVAIALAAALLLRAADDRSGSSGREAAELRTLVDRIENVLTQSAAGRAEIAGALAAGLECTISHREAGARIASVADNRQSVLDQLSGFQAPTQEADEILSLLQQSLQHSIEADRHYRDGFFALPPTSPCPLPAGHAFDLARASNANATAAKKRFVAAFDPLARRFGRRAWSAGEI